MINSKKFNLRNSNHVIQIEMEGLLSIYFKVEQYIRKNNNSRAKIVRMYSS